MKLVVLETFGLDHLPTFIYFIFGSPEVDLFSSDLIRVQQTHLEASQQNPSVYSQ